MGVDPFCKARKRGTIFRVHICVLRLKRRHEQDHPDHGKAPVAHDRMPEIIANSEDGSFNRRLVQIHRDRDATLWIPAVVLVIAIIGAHDINIIVLIPIVGPVFWPRVHEIEPKAAVLETRIPAVHFHGKTLDVEPLVRTEVASKAAIGNSVPAVAAALVPVAVHGLPVLCAMLLPHLPLLILLDTLPCYEGRFSCR
jgi:hypothetical protein